MRTWILLSAGALLASASVTTARAQGATGGGGLRFTSVSAGDAHSCGITAEGVAYCWGRNEHGQLGDSSTTDRLAPVPVAGGISFHAISAGGVHTCGIAADDSPYCWGGNDHGQLGIGTTHDQDYPAKVTYHGPGMGRLRVSAISAGAQHTCTLIIHWQRLDQAYCWGGNAHGQLGTRQVGPRGKFGPTDDQLWPVPAFGDTRYASVASGSQHSCAVSRDSTAYCWGENDRGQLGNSSRTNSPVRFPVRMRSGEAFTGVTVGAAHSCALTSEGKAYCWGDNSAGQVGNGKGGSSLTPAAVSDTLRFANLSAGGDATCGVRRAGGVVCWGSNAAGHFGTSAISESPTPIPVMVELSFSAVSLGVSHACGIQADGTAYCWGRLGNGSGESSTAPRPVAGQLSPRPSSP